MRTIRRRGEGTRMGVGCGRGAAAVKGEREGAVGGCACVVYVARMNVARMKYPRRFGFKPPAVTAIIPGGLGLNRRR